ncbi:MAG: zinc metallopeptidase [Leptospirales bacterium]|nr:zinc metallopeptidase [Leptospirales bacterium]
MLPLGLDPLYIMMMVPVLLLSLFSSFRVKSAFKKYSNVNVRSGLTGAEVARRILDKNGLQDVSVVETSGFLSDHYDPIKRTVRLSPDVYRKATVSAVGVAAHETGHAIQHKQLYRPLVLRNMMVPVASVGSNFAWIVIMAGFVMGAFGLVKVGIALFSLVVLFQILTLPVEFNASSRAKNILASTGMVSGSETAGVNAVLSAAAMTYVAAATSAIMTLLYFLLRAGLLGGRDD